ncbi:MAG: hypothetical protein ABUL68_04160, partial [Pseudomonadota bacterium]
MTFGAVLAAWLAVSAVTRGAEAPASLGVGASFETLQVGKISYQHVEVRSIGARSLMISHAGGLASVRLRDLSPELQAAFGYKPEDEAALNAAEAAQKSGKDPAPKSGPSATKRPPVASTLDRLGQSFGQPPEIRPTVDLRPRFLELGLNVKNQGPRPSCAVFALVSVLEYQNAKLSGRGER